MSSIALVERVTCRRVTLFLSRRKILKHRKFISASTEESNFLSDYCDDAINYANVKKPERSNGTSSHVVTGNVKKSSNIDAAAAAAAATAADMNVHRTASFSFFNVFFDIVFWPFVFLRGRR